MRHYIKLYFLCIKRSIIAKLEYKKDTLIALFSFVIANICSILSIYFLVNSIPALKENGHNWSMYQIGFLYGFSMIPVGIDHLFSDEFWLVAYRRVRNGTLDPAFLRPAPIMFQIFAETFQPEGFGELIVGAAMLILCGFNVSINWSFPLIFLLIIASIFGAIIITSLKIIFSGLAFVFKTTGPLLQVVYNFISYTKYPIGIYPYFLRAMLTFIFPFGIIISYPIQTIFFGNVYSWLNPWTLSLIIVLVAILFFFIAIVSWSLCVKKYESTGS